MVSNEVQLDELDRQYLKKVQKQLILENIKMLGLKTLRSVFYECH
jgi:hypothetical protein